MDTNLHEDPCSYAPSLEGQDFGQQTTTIWNWLAMQDIQCRFLSPKTIAVGPIFFDLETQRVTEHWSEDEQFETGLQSFRIKAKGFLASERTRPVTDFERDELFLQWKELTRRLFKL